MSKPRRFDELLVDLASAAMSVTHHDIDEKEAEYIYETDAMKRRFSVILKAHYSRLPTDRS